VKDRGHPANSADGKEFQRLFIQVEVEDMQDDLRERQSPAPQTGAVLLTLEIAACRLMCSIEQACAGSAVGDMRGGSWVRDMLMIERDWWATGQLMITG